MSFRNHCCTHTSATTEYCIMNHKNMPTDEFGIMNFPTDLILEIFFKLSVKDLLCCMGTCKLWYNLITDLNFTSDYTRNSVFTAILLFAKYDSRFFLVEIAPNGEFFMRSIQIKVPDHSEEGPSLSVIGLLDGLLLLLLRKEHDSLVREQVYFCNPLFRGCFKLEDHRIVDIKSHRTQYELGFVPSTNKFKLLSIVYQICWTFQEAHIFTIGEDDKWRRLEEPFSPFKLFALGTYYNGAYYWLAEDGNDVYIYAFDFGKEKWSRLGESLGLPSRSFQRKLRVIGNRLCMIGYCLRNSYEITIWTMEEHGVSWSLSKKILLQSCIPRTINDCGLLPMDGSRNGDILFRRFSKNRLIYFNPDTLKFIEIEACHYLRFARVYVPRFNSIQKDIRLGQYEVLEMSG